MLSQQFGDNVITCYLFMDFYRETNTNQKEEKIKQQEIINFPFRDSLCAPK